jgi:hypothetical protein
MLEEREKEVMTDLSKQALSIAELQEIFGFTNADLLANREGRYAFGQHRLLATGIGLLVFAIVVLLTWPIQREAGRILGFIGGLCFGGLDLIALLAGVSALGALWNSAQESRQTPLQRYSGAVTLHQSKDESWALVSDAFRIPIDASAAEKFIEGDYIVYYVPKFVNDRDNLFSIEPV